MMRLRVSSIILSISVSYCLYAMSLFKYTGNKRTQAPQKTLVATDSTQQDTTTQTQALPTQVPVTPVYNPNITVNVQLQNTNTNTLQVEQTVYTQVWQKTQTQVQQAFDQLKQYSVLHKKKLTLFTLGACYAGIQTTIWYLQHTLQRKHWWSFWKQEKNLQELYAISQKQLTHELLSALQTRYITTQNPLDYTTPLVQFTCELEQENKLLTRYKRIISTLERIKLSKLFFYKQQLIPEYTERLNRLAYIKSCFFTSLIEHKVNYIQ